MGVDFIALIACSVIWGLALLPAAAFAMMSPMIADDPATSKLPAVPAAIMIAMSFPVVIIISIAGAWALQLFGVPPLISLAVLLLPLAGVALFFRKMAEIDRAKKGSRRG